MKANPRYCTVSTGTVSNQVASILAINHNLHGIPHTAVELWYVEYSMAGDSSHTSINLQKLQNYRVSGIGETSGHPWPFHKKIEWKFAIIWLRHISIMSSFYGHHSLVIDKHGYKLNCQK